MRIWPIALVLMCALPVQARQPDGTLGLLRTPNDGMPALGVAGDAFDVIALRECSLAVEGPGGRAALPAAWTALPGGMAKARCEIPADLQAGAYALEAEANGERDRTERALFIVAEFPEFYAFAHVSDTHIGSKRHERSSTAIAREVIDAVNQSDASFVLVTGDLTENGSPDEFRAWLNVFSAFVPPVFVCPGNHDRGGGVYEAFFGPLTYAFTFGRDGYLSFDTKDFLMADGLGPQDSALERLRRTLKPLRHTFGFTHRYEPMMGMRAQLVLFVDDPLDALFYGHFHRANEAGENAVPWGATRALLTPAAIDGKWRLVYITAKGAVSVDPSPPEPEE